MRVFRRPARQLIEAVRARRALGLPEGNELSLLRCAMSMRRPFATETSALAAKTGARGSIHVTYRIEEAPDGSWRLFRALGDAPEYAVMRSASTVRPARFRTRGMVLRAFAAQRRIDRGAATRLGLDVRVELLNDP